MFTTAALSGNIPCEVEVVAIWTPKAPTIIALAGVSDAVEVGSATNISTVDVAAAARVVAAASSVRNESEGKEDSVTRERSAEAVYDGGRAKSRRTAHVAGSSS